MKKLVFWTAGGLGLAVACGLAGLPHLSATLVTLTTFLVVPVLIVHGIDFLSHAGGRTNEG